MEISEATRVMLGLTLITVPTIEFGGYFLLSQTHNSKIIKSELQRAFYRAGHAHAGVLVLLALIGQLLVGVLTIAPALEWFMRIGLFVSPILVSAGFFLGAPGESGKPTRWIRLIYAGALYLAASMLLLGVSLLLG